MVNSVDIIKLFCCILIIASHVGNIFANTTANYFYGQRFFRFCVPFFFMSSGYFFSGMDSGKKRSYIIRILAIYIISSVLYSVYIAENSPLWPQLVFGFNHLWYLIALAEGLILLLLFAGRELYKHREIVNMKMSSAIIFTVAAFTLSFIEAEILRRNITPPIYNDITIFGWIPAFFLLIIGLKVHVEYSPASMRTLRKVTDLVYILHFMVIIIAARQLELSGMSNFLFTAVVSFAVSSAVVIIPKRISLRKTMLLLASLIMSVSSSAYAYDIVIAGGGMGGISAAIQAARLGASVLVVEPTGMLGGQATAAGVSTMDDMSRLRENGIYHEFMDRVREHYGEMRKSIATSYWKTDGKAFEPSAGHKILADMAVSSDILFHADIVKVEAVEGGKSVTVRTREGTKYYTCKILIDATECGDVIPLAGLQYRSGNSLSPDMNPASMIQDITWTAVIRKYPKGVPGHLRPKSPLPDYEKARKNYTAYVSRNAFGAGDRSPFKLPAEFSAHNAYRAVPDSYLPGSYTGARKDWKRITKTGVNWGNDYPGQYGWDEKYGLPIAYLEDKAFREDINRKALIKTLHFIYYIQNELGETWSVDENEYDELPEAAKDLPDEWKNIARHLPPIPYVRECRRIVGEYTYNSRALYENSQSYRDGKNRELPDAIAIGGYIIDLHAGDDDDDFEHELGEHQASIREHEPAGAFQAPMRILIPASDDNFLAAEKNLSMSRLASGALRLQPVCMMTGQAVGTLAALSVSWDVKPRDIHPIHVQKLLTDCGVMLSLAEYSDVPENHKYYGAVQIATLYKLIEPEKYPVYPKQRISSPSKSRRVQGRFGVDRKITKKELAGIITKAEEAMKGKINAPEFHDGMTKGEAVSLIINAMDKAAPSLPDTEPSEHGVEKLITGINSQDAQ